MVSASFLTAEDPAPPDVGLAPADDADELFPLADDGTEAALSVDPEPVESLVVVVAGVVAASALGSWCSLQMCNSRWMRRTLPVPANAHTSTIILAIDYNSPHFVSEFDKINENSFQFF